MIPSVSGVLTKVLKGERSMTEAAQAVGLSERQLWRLHSAFERGGAAGLVHGNRGRPSARRLDEALRKRVVELARTTYAGLNDTHLSELLAEREGILISRVSLRRMLRAAGLPSKRRRRSPRYHGRRERMPAEGMLLQLDGSRHDWLEERGPRLSLAAAIDDATSRVLAATFREQAHAAGYLVILRAIVERHGLPGAVYRDRHGIFEAPSTRHTDGRDGGLPSQVGRALAELGIRSIAAGSPQAKGRIERLWGTFQDRLVAELRLAGIVEREAAEAFLPGFLERHNARFAVPPLDERPDWLAVPAELRLDHVFVLKYRRKVTKDHTIHLAGGVLRLPRARFAYSGRTVEVHLRLDGTLVAFDGPRQLALTAASPEPAQLRAQRARRSAPGLEPLAAEPPWVPPAEHPWRRVRRGTTLYDVRLTESLTR